jgi:hypothetical protein
VRLFGGVEDYGTHFLASMEPIERLDGAQVAVRLPERAKADLLEWSPGQDLTAWFNKVVQKEFEAAKVMHPDPKVRITDDRPYNEYFLLRGKQL